MAGRAGGRPRARAVLRGPPSGRRQRMARKVAAAEPAAATLWLATSGTLATLMP